MNFSRTRKEVIPKFIFIQKQERITEDKLKDTSSTRFKTHHRLTVLKTVWSWHVRVRTHACKAIHQRERKPHKKVGIRIVF